MTLLAAAATTTGLYNYIEKYAQVFKSSQNPALRLLLSAALFLGISFFMILFSLRVIHPESVPDKQAPQNVVRVNEKMETSSN